VKLTGGFGVSIGQPVFLCSKPIMLWGPVWNGCAEFSQFDCHPAVGRGSVQAHRKSPAEIGPGGVT
jgi:hypothetical protein